MSELAKGDRVKVINCAEDYEADFTGHVGTVARKPDRSRQIAVRIDGVGQLFFDKTELQRIER